MSHSFIGTCIAASVLALTAVGCAADEEEEDAAESSEAIRGGSCTKKLEYWSVDDVAGAKSATCWSSNARPGTTACSGPWREIDLRKGQTLVLQGGSPGKYVSADGVLEYWMLGVARADGLSGYVGTDAPAGHAAQLVYKAKEDVKLRVSTSYGFRAAARGRETTPTSSIRVISLTTTC